MKVLSKKNTELRTRKLEFRSAGGILRSVF
jgi:hypothetical protein